MQKDLAGRCALREDLLPRGPPRVGQAAAWGPFHMNTGLDSVKMRDVIPPKI